MSHDPNKKAASGIAPKWKALFGETRKTFLEDMATIAISHRAVRLRALQRMAEKGRDPGNMVLTASLMKQAAEEVGNAYTNRHELTGKDGKDLPVRVSPGYRATIWMRSPCLSRCTGRWCMDRDLSGSGSVMGAIYVVGPLRRMDLGRAHASIRLRAAQPMATSVC